MCDKLEEDKPDCDTIIKTCEKIYEENKDPDIFIRIFIDYIVEYDNSYINKKDKISKLSDYLITNYLKYTEDDGYDPDIEFAFESICKFCTKTDIINKIIEKFKIRNALNQDSIEMYIAGIEAAKKSKNDAFVNILTNMI